MTDRAAKIAEFLIECRGMAYDVLGAELSRRFPGLTDDEFNRGTDIAVEFLQAEAAEHGAKADALENEAARRKRGGAS